MPPSIAFNGFILTSAFQPIYGVGDGRAVGYECLIRSADQDGVILRPSRLFDHLDEAEIVSLDRTCRTLHLRSFASIDPGERILYLNIHPVALIAEARNAKLVRSRIGYFGLTPERVCIEILEGSCSDEGELVDAVAAFREMGISIAMDDFGVARSNFDRVAALRPDYVKIDRTLLSDAVGDEKARRMLPSVIDILHETGARVVVEGVEDASAALVAIEAGADFLQGFYFATPATGLHDDALTERILRELVRMRGSRLAPANDAIDPAVPASAIARLLNSARRISPTIDSLNSYRDPAARAVE